MGEVKLQLLGPIEVLSDGQPVVLGGPIVRQLFVQLALSPGVPVPHDRLVEAIWEDHAPPSAQTALRVHVNRLRVGLRPTDLTVLHQSGGYVLAGDAVVLDVHDLDALDHDLSATANPVDALALVDRALALWRGASMADLRRLPFSERLAAQLDRRLDLLGWRHDQLLVETGQGGAAIPQLEGRLRTDPRDQAAWVLLARANCQVGRLANALAICRQARTELVERGLVPGRDLEVLESQLLNNEVPVDREPVAPRRLSAPVGLLAAAPSELYGRRDELAQLEAFIDEVQLRRTSLVVRVLGEAGVGKTALASVFARTVLARGHDVVHAWCEDTPRQPLSPLAPALTAMLDDEPPGDRSPLAGLVRRYLGGTGSTDLALGDADAAELRRQLIEGVRQVIERGTVQPLVVLLDDAHWIDELTNAVLQELVRRPVKTPCLVVTLARDSQQQRGGAPAIELRRLPQPALADWLSASASGAALDTVMSLTGGLPLLVEATLRELRGGAELASLPGQLSEFVWNSRFNRLPTSALRPIRFAAVMGPRVQFDRLRAVTGHPELDLLEDLDVAVTAGILRPDRNDPNAYQFTHDLVRRSILDRCSALHLRRLHAEVLAHIPANSDPLAALYHGRRALGHVGEAALCRLTADAARALLDRSAFAEARAELDATIAVATGGARARLLTLLARAEAASDDTAGARAHLDDALVTAREAADPEATVEAVIARSIFGHRFVHDPMIQATLRDAIDRLPPQSVALRIAGLHRLALERRDAGRVDESAEVLDELRPLTDQIQDRGSRLSGLLIEHGVLEAAGRREERLATAAKARELAHPSLDLEARYRLLMIELDECFLGGDEEQCERHMADFAEVADAQGSPYMQWMIRVVRFTAPFRRGAITLARRIATDGFEFGRAARVAGAYGAFASQLYAAEWIGGDLAPFIDDLRRVDVADGPSLPWRSGLALALAAAGDVAGASAELDQIAEKIPTEGGYWLGFVGVALSMDAASICGHAPVLAAAAPLMRRRLGDQVVLGTGAIDYGPAKRYLALSELGAGDRALGEQLLRDVVAEPRSGTIWQERAAIDLLRHGFEVAPDRLPTQRWRWLDRR